MKVFWVQTKLSTYNKIADWWPIYAIPHRDPELGGGAEKLHHHIAWNRVPDLTILKFKSTFKNTALDKCILDSESITVWDYDRPTPIIGPNVSGDTRWIWKDLLGVK